MDEESNFVALQDFLEYWDNKGDMLETPEMTGRPSFLAVVAYESQKRTITIVTLATCCVLSGPEDGSVSLRGLKDFQPEDYHFGFRPNFREYRYSERTHALIAGGKSGKMGVHKATVTPVTP